MCIEDKISKFMIKISKFEFFMINENIELAHIQHKDGLQKLAGVRWEKLAALIEQKHRFSVFDFKSSGFVFFKETSPQYLVKDNGSLKWDSDEVTIDSWSKLLTRSFAQLRNNIAHGNKAHILAPFTRQRTEEFIDAGNALVDFIAKDIFSQADWEMPIEFQN